MSGSLRALPSVDLLLREIEDLRALGPVVARWLCRRTLDRARDRVLAGGEAGDVRALVANEARALLERSTRRVINATGVILHTNLGRAPLSKEAVDAAVRAAGATPIEYDVASGRRGERAPVARSLAAALCDAEDALIVNNNAAAIVLCLTALARGREVIVSRGELVEIGGGFRLPEIMETSGALLREVGTTNRTRARDYADAASEHTAMLLAIHPSNFRITGFTATPSVAELVEVAHAAGIPLVYDVGSGLLRPQDGVLADEPDATTAIATGADLVCFSGDKLLGGPQAGILVGRADLVERMRVHPLARALRADKLTLAALEATLWLHALDRPTAVDRMIHADPRARADALAASIGATVVEGESVAGGGSTPDRSIPTALVAVQTADPTATARALRRCDPPIIARVERDRILIDLRTVDPSDDEHIAAALRGSAPG